MRRTCDMAYPPLMILRLPRGRQPSVFLASPNFAYSLVEFSGARGANGASHEVSSQDGIHTHTPWALGHRWIPACMPRMRGVRTTAYPLLTQHRPTPRCLCGVWWCVLSTHVYLDPGLAGSLDCDSGSAQGPSEHACPHIPQIMSSTCQHTRTSAVLFLVQLLSHSW